MENLKYLLKEINILNQRIKAREEYEDSFNLFEILHKRTEEVELHSRFISVLLDPKGSHKMKDSFVQLFVSKLNLPFEYNLTTLEVRPNERNRGEYKEIDILLIDRQQKSAVIIENKINAKDSNHEHDGQIERYYGLIHDEEIPEDSISVLYLSIDRDGPSDDSVNKSKRFPHLKDKVISIHYGVEILEWLRDCVKECYAKPFLRESIIQYIKLVEQMTNNNTTEEDIKILMQVVGTTNDNLMSAKRLIDNSKHLHWWAVFEFWKHLSEKLVALGFKIRQRIENDVIDDLIHGSAIKRNKADFNLKLTTPDNIDFTINADHDNFLCVGVTDSDVAPGCNSMPEVFYQENKNRLNLEQCDNWPFYKFIEFNSPDGLKLADFSNELTFRLVSKDHREEIVNAIIKQTQEMLKLYTDAVS